MDINALIDRAKNVVLSPQSTLEAAKAEQPSMQDLITYVAIVAVPTLIGIIIGYGVVGIGTFGFHYKHQLLHLFILRTKKISAF